MKNIVITLILIMPFLAFSQETSYVCDTIGKTLTASASGGTGTVTYSWSGPGGATTGATRNVTVAGTYTWTATDSLGCTASGTHEVIYELNPTEAITINANNTCLNTSQTISATGVPAGYTYSWTFDAGSSPSSSSSPSQAVEWSTTGAKTITLTITRSLTGSANGCSDNCTWTKTKVINVGNLTGSSSCG